MGFWGVHVLYAVRDAILIHCACPATIAVTLARLRISCGLRKVLGNPKDNYDVSASVFLVQFNGFMSLTS